MVSEKIPEELKERVAACETPEEVLALAKEEGYELSDGELESIAGGGWGSSGRSPKECPKCHTTEYTQKIPQKVQKGYTEYTCSKCGEWWVV